MRYIVEQNRNNDSSSMGYATLEEAETQYRLAVHGEPCTLIEGVKYELPSHDCLGRPRALLSWVRLLEVDDTKPHVKTYGHRGSIYHQAPEYDRVDATIISAYHWFLGYAERPIGFHDDIFDPTKTPLRAESVR